MLSKGKKKFLGVVRPLIGYLKANETFFHITTAIKELRLEKINNWRASCKKGVYRILADFHFLQDRANFWQTDLFWHGKHRSVIEGFGGKRALGFLLKIELSQKRSKFRMQFCLGVLNNVLYVFLLKFSSFTRYYVWKKACISGLLSTWPERR